MYIDVNKIFDWNIFQRQFGNVGFRNVVLRKLYKSI